MVSLTDRRVLVLGSAPLARPLQVEADELVVAVNGGIGSWPLVDVWVLNSRDIDAGHWSPTQRGFSRAFLAQGAGRRVPVALLFTKHDEAAAATLRLLRRQGTIVESVLELHNDQRRAMETAAGARSAAMTKQALSAGMSAAAWAFWMGAASVRLAGMSWAAGYAYPTPLEPLTRGHEAGDKEALVRLQAKYPGRLTHTFTKETDAMSTKKKTTGLTPSRPPAAKVEASRASRRSARGATTPAAEHARKKAKAKAVAVEKAKAPARSTLLVRATAKTFYENRLYKPGMEFRLSDPTHFRDTCMEWVDPNAPRPAAAADLSDGRTPRQLAPNAADEVPIGSAGRTRARDTDNPLGVE